MGTPYYLKFFTGSRFEYNETMVAANGFSNAR